MSNVETIIGPDLVCASVLSLLLLLTLYVLLNHPYCWLICTPDFSGQEHDDYKCKTYGQQEWQPTAPWARALRQGISWENRSRNCAFRPGGDVWWDSRPRVRKKMRQWTDLLVSAHDNIYSTATANCSRTNGIIMVKNKEYSDDRAVLSQA